MRRSTITVAFTAVLLVGIAVLAYPFAAAWINKVVTANKVHSYAEAVESADTDAIMEEARRYNREMLPIPIGDPYSTAVDDSDLEYDQMLRVPGTDVMARISIPSVTVDLPVYHGTSDSTLRKGAGHLYGTSLPIGGEGTHASISAHTGMPEARFFDRLVDVTEADIIYVDVLDESLAYEVDTIRVVTPDEGAHMVGRQPGKDLLTLITCTPYGVNSHRLIVTGHRIPYVAHTDNDTEATHIDFPWWLVVAGSCAALSIAYAIRQRR